MLDFAKMTLQDWNPLSHFKELGIFCRTLFLIGFVFLGVGFAQGPSTQNKTAVLALILVSLSLTVHYFSHWAYPVVIDRPSIKWSHVFSGIAMTVITAGLVWWLWVIYGKPMP